MKMRAAVGLWAVMSSVAGAADFSHYRGFELGSNLVQANLQPGVNASSVRLVQQRPAIIEELDWYPAFHYQKVPADSDPVRNALLRFYNHELFQIVVNYDSQRIQGMTEADMVKGISLLYGPSAAPGGEIIYRSSYGEKAKVLAQWGDEKCTYSLVRTGGEQGYALVASLVRLDRLAQDSMAEASRLDVAEAPQKAMDLKAKQDREHGELLERARATSVSAFRP